MLAHELIALCNPDHELYGKLRTSLKFDLGDFEDLEPMAEIGSPEFYETPAPNCLYQVEWFGVSYLVHSEQQHGGAVWQSYIKRDGRWIDINVEFFKGPNSPPDQDRTVLIGARKHSSEILWGAKDATNASRDMFDGLTDDERNAAVVGMFVSNAVEVFSCSNVKRVEHKPSEKQNIKRAKKGKLPRFSYWTLHIEVDSDTEGGGQAGGSRRHAPPRLHVRRGHIRRLSDGRRVWVRAALVGDKSRGAVVKDYRVTA